MQSVFKCPQDPKRCSVWAFASVVAGGPRTSRWHHAALRRLLWSIMNKLIDDNDNYMSKVKDGMKGSLCKLPSDPRNLHFPAGSDRIPWRAIPPQWPVAAIAIRFMNTGLQKRIGEAHSNTSRATLLQTLQCNVGISELQIPARHAYVATWTKTRTISIYKRWTTRSLQDEFASHFFWVRDLQSTSRHKIKGKQVSQETVVFLKILKHVHVNHLPLWSLYDVWNVVTWPF